MLKPLQAAFTTGLEEVLVIVRVQTRMLDGPLLLLMLPPSEEAGATVQAVCPVSIVVVPAGQAMQEGAPGLL